MVSRLSDTFPPIDPASFLRLASELAGRRNPAELRSAGDRAYYAAFLTIRDQLERKNYALFTVGGPVHTEVRQVLRNINRRMGYSLNELRLARNALTYQTGPVALQQGHSLRWMLNTARTIINYVNSLPERI